MKDHAAYLSESELTAEITQIKQDIENGEISQDETFAQTINKEIEEDLFRMLSIKHMPMNIKLNDMMKIHILVLFVM